MKPLAYISEVFSSLQGEGPHTGEPMTFVRLAGCGLACRWCDSDTALNKLPSYRVENPPRSRHFLQYTNPVAPEKLNEHLLFFTDPVISVTGGEPLEQVNFLKTWLPEARKNKKILLETNGIYAKELEAVSKHIDIISMDLKLPSSTMARAYWQEHRAFLAKALQSGRETYIKIVLTPDTTDKDINEAIKLVSSANKFIPVVLQPASETERFHDRISEERLQSVARLCSCWLPNVTIMPQMHKELGLL